MEADQSPERLKEEIQEDGEGAEFKEIFDQGKEVEAGEFIRWQFTEAMGGRAVAHLTEKFQEF